MTNGDQTEMISQSQNALIVIGMHTTIGLHAQLEVYPASDVVSWTISLLHVGPTIRQLHCLRKAIRATTVVQPEPKVETIEATTKGSGTFRNIRLRLTFYYCHRQSSSSTNLQQHQLKTATTHRTNGFKISAFNCTFVHRPGISNIADYYSRSPSKNNTGITTFLEELRTENYINAVVASALPAFVEWSWTDNKRRRFATTTQNLDSSLSTTKITLNS